MAQKGHGSQKVSNGRLKNELAFAEEREERIGIIAAQMAAYFPLLVPRGNHDAEPCRS